MKKPVFLFFTTICFYTVSISQESQNIILNTDSEFEFKTSKNSLKKVNSEISISGLRLWLRSDSTNVDSLSKISEWYDLSGNNFNLIQLNQAARPTLDSNQINGLPTVLFDGVDDFLQTSGSIHLLGKDTLSLTITMLLKSNVSQKAYANLFDYDHDSFYGFTIQQNGGTTNEVFGYASVNLTDTFKIYIFELQNGPGGISRVTVNGIETSSSVINSAIGFTEPRRLALGHWLSLCCGTPSREWGGELAELMVYNRLLNSSEKSELNYYFQEKYGTIDNPLPVEMTDLIYQKNRNQIILKWETKTETNNAGWEIQEGIGSKEQGTWKKIGFVIGKGTTTEKQNYNFASPISRNASQLSFRLKQIDLDGTFKYSNKIEVTNEIPNTFSLEQNYPNPFNPATTIKFSLPENGKVNLTIFDLLGRQVRQLADKEMEANYQEISWDGKNDKGVSVSSGVYFYRISVEGISGNKFANTKKMLMMK